MSYLVVKRNGEKVAFDKAKIVSAINKAMGSYTGYFIEGQAEQIADKIYDKVSVIDRPVTVKEIEDDVYYLLIELGNLATAKAYEGYRSVQEFKRIVSPVDKNVKDIINSVESDVTNENSNKDAKLSSTQRDLIAGEVSKDLARRELLPPDILLAHDTGAIHFHDMDYIIQPMFNCFSSDTEFVTDKGVFPFKHFISGEKVNVLDKNGMWREAVVKSYGKQKLQEITLTSGRSKKVIRATYNHRWILRDGSFTTDLQVGDRLALLPEGFDGANNKWEVESIVRHSGSEREVWCVEEPVTHTFTLAGGIVTGNCSLVNLKDMLENGTVINGKKIDSPRSFQVACTITTQIIAQVASSQYGGQSINGFDTVLAPFLHRSYKRYLNDVKREQEIYYGKVDDEIADKIAWERTRKELEAGIQTIQYQINTLMTTNGQAPFVTLFLHFENDFEFAKEAAMIQEEVLKQRLQGIKNEQNVYVTPAFPKLIYCLTEDNAKPGSKYYYITELAAKCTAKRMYPDYISAKKMRELFDGNVFSPMGCLDYDETVEIAYDNVIGERCVDRFRIGEFFDSVYDSLNSLNKLSNVYDNGKCVCLNIADAGFVRCVQDVDGSYVRVIRVMRNSNITDWVKVSTDVRSFLATSDHPLIIDGEVVKVGNLKVGDFIVNSSGDKEIVVSVENVEKCDFSYDLETESGTFVFSGVQSHNCRSFLSTWKDENGNYKFDGRFNMGVVSLNLPQIAILSKGDEGRFFELLNKRMLLVKDALMLRYNLLKNVSADVSPIHYMYGAISRLPKGAKIYDLLQNGYATISFGYIGIYEMTKLMTGVSHTDPEGREFALKVINTMEKATKDWKAETGLGFGLYGTPAESLTHRFCSIDRKRFGVIKDITDKGYYTNSYHVDVREPIDVFSKFSFEAEFQKHSTGGMISYAEIPNLVNNPKAIEKLIQYIYDNISYAEFNTKSDYCHVCGFDGEIICDNETWICPQCKNTDKNKLTVIRRTCGYLGENFWNEGKTKEINSRVLHI